MYEKLVSSLYLFASSSLFLTVYVFRDSGGDVAEMQSRSTLAKFVVSAAAVAKRESPARLR
jgi:hypothetical protein